MEDPQPLRAAATTYAAGTAWLFSHTDQQLLGALRDWHAIEQLAHAATAHLIHELVRRDIPTRHGATNPTSWLRNRLLVSGPHAGRLLRQARLLDTEPSVDAAMTAGDVNTDQLAAIGAALHRLPRRLNSDQRTKAAGILTSQAATLTPDELRIAGDRILDLVAPDLADTHAVKLLEERERDAHERRYLSLTKDGNGGVRLRGHLTPEAAAILNNALDPLCTPRQAAQNLATSGEPTTPGQRRADALISIAERILAGATLPSNGGDRPQITVTVDYDTLHQQLGAGRLDNGEAITADTVRRLACDARIVPMVLGSDGQVLNVGRTSRSVPTHIRRAVIVRDGGFCAFPGCDRPQQWTQVHHLIHWSQGGPTDLDNLILLCTIHHHVIHHKTAGWRVQINPGQRPEFIPPPWIDLQQRPRRNIYHQHE